MSVTLHTSLGDLKIELDCACAPRLAENFLALAASGAYDGTVFHRNIPGFLVQGGDPTGTGKGGDSIFGGKLPDEIHPALKHDARGVVAAANSGPNTNGSQFYIAYSKQASLDGVYSVIGRVIHGWETLEKIERLPTGKKHRPLEPPVVQSVTIHANPFAST